MPLYRVLNKNTSAPPPVEPTRRVARPELGPKSRSKAARDAGQTKSASVAVPDSHLSAVVGWLAIISGPGRGQVLPLSYGVNDIGRSAAARVRLDYGDSAIGRDNQAAIIYTARSRRFYLQSVAAETWLNGQPARGSVELAGGDVLQLGTTRLKFAPLCGPDFDWHDDNE